MTTNPSVSRRRTRATQLIIQALPWAVFAVLMAWSWGWRSLTATLPTYGDTMETVVGTMWLDEALSAGKSPLIYPLNYFPEGWRVASHSAGMAIAVLLWPLHKLGGPVFAANVAALLSCLIAYLGAYLVARAYLDRLTAILPAVAFTFWAMRWYELMGGILQIFLGSALIPWMIWSVERGFRSEKRRLIWLALAGAFWSLAFMITQYFAVAGGAVVATWILLCQAGPPRPWRRRLGYLAVAAGFFLLFSAPWQLLNGRETALADPSYYSIQEVNGNSASLNSLPLPFLYHPWLGTLARRLFLGQPWEASVANLGLAASVAALVGAALAFRRRKWRPVLGLTAVGLVLTVGMTLHWNGQAVSARWLEPLNRGLWQLGHALKPDFFTGLWPPPPFDTAVPLPGYLLAILVPLFERGRMFSRYGLVAVLGVYMLAGLAITRLQHTWQRLLLGGVLLFALIPPRLEVHTWPPQPHPGFVWLSEHLPPGEGVINVVAIHPTAVGMTIGGETLLAAQFHHLPTASGSAGVKPRHALFLEHWLATHEHPYWQPDLPAILRSYRVRYIALQMEGDWEPGLWQEAMASKEFTPVGCFPPPEPGDPWGWPVCVVEVPPNPRPDFNLMLHEGWSGLEDWGVWGEGTESHAQWVITSRTPQRLSLAAFPMCLPDKKQQIEIEVNGTVVATQQWQNCDPWSTTVDIPASLVQVGANDLIVRSAYASRPPDNPAETRQLSTGFTKLRIDPVPPG